MNADAGREGVDTSGDIFLLGCRGLGAFDATGVWPLPLLPLRIEALIHLRSAFASNRQRKGTHMLR